MTCNAKQIPYSNLSNAVEVLHIDAAWTPERLWYDEFFDRVYLANSPAREWRDDDTTSLTAYMQKSVGMGSISEQVVGSAVRYVARQRPRHVVRQWLQSLKWDGVTRIAHAFQNYWGATAQPADYVCAASANFFIGMVARVMQPGCKLDTMPVFEGQQGIRKSSALEVLGGPWYAVVNELVTSKDFLQGMRGKWILEIAELQSFSRSDISHVKSIMSTRSDTYRPSYGRASVDYPRQCVFAGTTNVDDWGSDDTGLRRFWPITCDTIDLSGLRENRDQLFAEAMAVQQREMPWWVMPGATEQQQLERQHHDEWSALITTWADLEILKGSTHVTVPDLALQALKLPVAQLDKSAQMRIARVLRLSGWVRKTAWLDGKASKAWFPQGGNVVRNSDDFIT